MNDAADSIFRWLSASDAGLREVAEDIKGVEVEAFLERLLWEGSAGFVDGPLRELTYEGRPATNVIKYFSYPLYSHYKKARGLKPEWITRFPLYFKAGESRVETADIIARYALLYAGLTKQQTGYSFTGFAGNEGLGSSDPARYVIMTLDNLERGTDPVARLLPDDTREIVQLQGAFPIFDGLRSVLDSLRAEILSATTPWPLLSGGFAARNHKEFWDWFIPITERHECREAVDLIVTAADEIRPSTSDQLNADIQTFGGISTNQASELCRFMFWNHALGFHRLVYIPFRSVEPRGADEGPVVHSWGGIILSLTDEVVFDQNLMQQLTRNGLAGSVTRRPSLLDPLLAGFKMLVDVATARACIGDWTHHQFELARTQLRHDHAGAIRSGFLHEISHLQRRVKELREGTVPDPELDRDLDLSYRLAQLVWDAHVQSDASIEFGDLLANLQAMLGWLPEEILLEREGLIATDRVPAPLMYILGELCRNARKFPPNDASLRLVIIAFKRTTLGLNIEVRNSTRSTDTRREFRKGKIEIPTRPQRLGLFLVGTVTCESLNGEFDFIIEKGKATAIVRLP